MSAHWLDLPTFGARLKYARERAKLSQDELAQRLGKAARQTVGRWERDGFEPTLDEIVKLADICKVDRNWLAFDDGVPHPLDEVEAFLRTDEGRKLDPEAANLLSRHCHRMFPDDHPTLEQIRGVLSLIALILRPARQREDGEQGEPE